VANVNYDNEYAWGSAILSHSENDLLRPVIFHPTVIVPDAPLFKSTTNGKLKWIDPTPIATAATDLVISTRAATPTWATNDPKNETMFSVERATISKNASGINVLSNFVPLGSVPANVTSFTDTTWLSTEDYSYKIIATNAAGSAFTVDGGATPPTGLTATIPALTGTPVLLSWTDNATNESGYLVEVSIDGGLTYTSLAVVPGAAAGTGLVSYSAAATLGKINMYRVSAVVTDTNLVTGQILTSSIPASATANLTLATPAVPVFSARNTTVNAANGAVTLNWGAVTGASAYLVAISSGGVAIAGSPFPVTTNTYAPALPLGSAYSITVAAQASKFSGALVATSAPSVAFVADLSAPVAPAAPTGLTTTLASTTSVTLNWVDNATTETAYLVEVSTDGGTTFSTLTTPALGANTRRYTATGLVAGTTYVYRVSALTVKFGSPLTTTASGFATSAPFSLPTAPTNVVATSIARVPASTTRGGPITVTWTQATSASVTGFTVTSGGRNVCSNLAATATSCTYTTGITKGTSYTFQVNARTAIGNFVSAPSAPVTAN
jgi:titin